MRRRVLLLIKGLGRGGAEQLLVSAARYRDRERFEYAVAYLLPEKDALVEELDALDVPAHCLEGRHGLAWAARLRRLIHQQRIDLVHMHSPVAAAVGRLVLPRRVRIVYTEHNVWARYHPATRWANRLTFRRNAHVFAVSREVHSSIRVRRLTPPIETLHHGLDPEAFYARELPDGVREELGVSPAAPLIGSVGNFKPSKGQGHLLRAAALVRRTHPDARFVMVGIGPLLERARSEARSLGLDGGVIFTGFREDAPRIASAYDIYVQPSEAEGLPIALLEAMALSRPVVATRVGGTPEVIEDGLNGLLVPPRDPEALAAAILRLLRDDILRARLGEAAKVRARDFDIRTAVGRMEAVYEELLA